MQPNTYPSRATLFLFNHQTMKVTRLQVDVPDLRDSDPPRAFRMPALKSAASAHDDGTRDEYLS